MLFRLHAYQYDLIYVPISEIVLADTLSRAYPATDADGNVVPAEFSEELAALKSSKNQQMQDLRMVASYRTIDAIRAAAADDVAYQQLMEQISVGWQSSPVDLPTELRP